MALSKVPATALASGAARGNFGAGAVLQVVEAEFVTGMSTSSSANYVDTGIQASITPSSTTSKILVFARVPLRLMGYTYGSIRWQRNGSTVYEPPTLYEFGVTAANADLRIVSPYMFQDSPNSTSAQVYKAQVVSYSGATVEVMPASHRAVLTLMEIAG
jgi:hypothetical protein